jgi:dihydroorotase
MLVDRARPQWDRALSPLRSERAPADLILIDIDTPRIIDAAQLLSKSKNSAFDGRRLPGRVLMTVVDGRVVFEVRDEAAD